MEKKETVERDLLYYDNFQIMPRTWKGSPIYHFNFKNVKTGEEVTLGACWHNEEVSDAIGGYYYEDIMEVAQDFDILWKISDNKIGVVAETFEEVEAEYNRMLSEGVDKTNINSTMMTLYNIKPVEKQIKKYDE